jgi:hypothetical protein
MAKDNCENLIKYLEFYMENKSTCSVSTSDRNCQLHYLFGKKIEVYDCIVEIKKTFSNYDMNFKYNGENHVDTMVMVTGHDESVRISLYKQKYF